MTDNAEEKDFQAAMLAKFRREGGLLAVWLVSGKRLIGRLKGFDRFTILLEHAGEDHLVFKHAIATIGPARDVHPRE
ncbi:MAG TPA: RNA chaperone Hfq [Acidobacteriota bacterium]|nr:RNA chaperone Hfq [bacterium]HNX19171.1 RNA chaperone Hfq [Acidobacteriota bacterium]